MEKPKTTYVPAPIIPHRCFFIVSESTEKNGKPLAITVTDVDAYAPRHTEIYNAFLSTWEGT